MKAKGYVSSIGTYIADDADIVIEAKDGNMAFLMKLVDRKGGKTGVQLSYQSE
ncbi:hypothetical protein MKY34_15690 [Sporosarcina sp. FSL K6-1522]|uniref:hypothetical protein n=1 Tax=Sporosarcina sp. FSL K6-1522 TaxID=2921554 RepID=UPI003159BA73